MHKMLAAAALAAAILFSGAPSAHAVDGAALFEQECADCHSARQRHKKGPGLAGTVGRKAGTAPGFAGYSDALVGSGIEWTPATLDAYIRDPRAAVPGGRMRYDGLSDAAGRAAIIDFLARQR